MRRLLCAVALFALATVTTPAVEPLPALTAPVNDIAHVIDADSARELDARIRALQKASGDVVVVATVETFAPYGSIEEYAVKLFQQAGIGQKNKDNGLLIVVAVRERKARVEVGYGLEALVTDGFSGEVIRRDMLPAFGDNRYGAGLLAGATSIVQHIAAARGVALEGVPAEEPAAPMTRGELIGGIVLSIAIGAIALGAILFVIALIARKTGGARKTPLEGGPLGSGSGSSSRRSSDDDNAGGSSFGGFGGGKSGGGGASGRW